MEHLPVLGIMKQPSAIFSIIEKINDLAKISLAVFFFVGISLDYAIIINTFTKYLVISLLFTWLIFLSFVKYLVILEYVKFQKSKEKLSELSVTDTPNLMMEIFLQAIELFSVISLFICVLRFFELMFFDQSDSNVYILMSVTSLLLLFSIVEFLTQMRIFNRLGKIEWHIFQGLSNNFLDNVNPPEKRSHYISAFITKAYASISCLLLVNAYFFGSVQYFFSVGNNVLISWLVLLLIQGLIYAKNHKK